MKVYQDFDQLPVPTEKTVLSIGNFDGVHVGHQAILRQAVAWAGQLNKPVYALTFDPHPLAVVRPALAPGILTPLDEKLRLMAELGLPAVVVAASRMELLSLTAREFMEQVVRPRFNPGWLVEGADFGFGRGRQGNIHVLAELGIQTGFSLTVAGEVDVQDENDRLLPVSSTYVREHLKTGDLAAARACLGRPYRLLGRVVKGKERGRLLGYPTANLDVQGQLVPAPGVYAGRAYLAPLSFCEGQGEGSTSTFASPKGGGGYPAAISIGTNLTFDPGAPPTIEAHLLDYDGDLYGERLGLDLHVRLRDMQRFESPTALVRQIQSDVERTREAVG